MGGYAEFGNQAFDAVIEASPFWWEVIHPMVSATRRYTQDVVYNEDYDIYYERKLPFGSPTNDDGLMMGMMDKFPYGVGISPDKEGSLVGVIHSEGRTYFVWRRTDEEFQEFYVGNSTNMGWLSFEASREDSKDGYFADGDYWLRSLSLYEYDFVDQFIVEGGTGRKLYAVGGRDPELTVEDPYPVPDNNEETDGAMVCDSVGVYGMPHTTTDTSSAYTLDTPVYVMFSKQWMNYGWDALRFPDGYPDDDWLQYAEDHDISFGGPIYDQRRRSSTWMWGTIARKPCAASSGVIPVCGPNQF
jgi:hypothetical protein